MIMLWVKENIKPMPIEKRPTEISNRPEIYQIRVKGKLDEGWSVWLDGMAVELESEVPPVTSLTGEVTDQACLRGILTRLWNLNLSLISVNRKVNTPVSMGKATTKRSKENII
jgi:hypothetical protein